MCGIAGIVSFRAEPEAGLRASIRGMTATLVHRGPDDEGFWLDSSCGVAFGHRRLSILDLTAAGHQPMLSRDGRWVLNYNGEIYNHAELRGRLQAYPFVGHSDTEVLLAACELWGAEVALPQLNGMFAFALWDRRQRVLYLARDRFGEKPLYYGWVGDHFLFASELKAIRAFPGSAPQIDRDALALYFRHNCVPAPRTIYQHVFKLPPASYLRLGSAHREAAPIIYWSLRDSVEKGITQPFKGSTEDAVAQLEALLRASVRHRMLADVPVGAFLSGGVDSSLIVALMQAIGGQTTRTFSIGLSDTAYNEAEEAKTVARHLGAHHTELYVQPAQALELVSRLPAIYDEPFADSSQIPLYLLSQLARRDVKVALSGDGGDEIFGGYNRYQWVQRIWRGVGWLPQPMRRLAALAMTALAPEDWDSGFRHLKRALPQQMEQRLPGDKLHKLSSALDCRDPREMYLRLTSHWQDPEPLVLGSSEPETIITLANGDSPCADFTAEMMYLDSRTYLPDDILTKVDRASMAVSLEVRAPFLDPAVVEFAWSLPQEMKLHDGCGKWILRQLLHRFVPSELVERPKMGFGIPLDSWLRGPLRPWAEELLAPERLRREGFLDSAIVQEKWQQHLSGRRAWQYHLWDVLMFQSWLEQWQRQPAAAEAARP